MNHDDSKVRILSFGEILWDVFPHAIKPGGAPLNVTYHLNRLGVESRIISRVGDDVKGRKLLEIMEGWAMGTDFCQQDHLHATSEVIAKMDDHYETTYEILYPVAWDFIHWEKKFFEAASQSDALVFGSLVMRNEVSYKTLTRLLEAARFRVFDVNLRHPHYKQDVVLAMLEKTNLLKVNQAELEIISSWISPQLKDDLKRVTRIQEIFNIAEVIVTRGSDGASYFADGKRYDQHVHPVTVADTVGSGDAFLAAFLAKKFESDSTIEAQLDAATLLGAFVATQAGACPPYTQKDLDTFRKAQTVQIDQNPKG